MLECSVCENKLNWLAGPAILPTSLVLFPLTPAAATPGVCEWLVCWAEKRGVDSCRRCCSYGGEDRVLNIQWANAGKSNIYVALRDKRSFPAPENMNAYLWWNYYLSENIARSTGYRKMFFAHVNCRCRRSSWFVSWRPTSSCSLLCWLTDWLTNWQCYVYLCSSRLRRVFEQNSG